MIYKKTITNFITRLSQLVELETTKSDFTKANKLPKSILKIRMKISPIITKKEW